MLPSSKLLKRIFRGLTIESHPDRQSCPRTFPGSSSLIISYILKKKNHFLKGCPVQWGIVCDLFGTYPLPERVENVKSSGNIK